ncbi:MAG: sigma-70 family RNA polymerase sigma factor [Phycisphaerae bacterium]|nr:sigma-70 family RNA polymerase sigma factor [Phycisphaerae bacterium]
MLEDRRLLWRLRHGDKDALRRIYEKYEGDLLTLAAHLLRDPATAEDVVQDVFIGLVRTVPKLHLRRTLRAYLATAVANRARDHFRKRSRERLAPIEDAGQMAADTGEPVQIVGAAELVHKLRAAVAELPYEQREVVMLRVYAGLKFREIAAHQNISIKTALSRYQYGLDKLRSMLNGEVPK